MSAVLTVDGCCSCCSSCAVVERGCRKSENSTLAAVTPVVALLVCTGRRGLTISAITSSGVFRFITMPSSDKRLLVLRISSARETRKRSSTEHGLSAECLLQRGQNSTSRGSADSRRGAPKVLGHLSQTPWGFGTAESARARP